ncbi:hypothetical protein GIB67_023805 [Kingdonia uniflora]|uniref:Uncharacterized protein n=1 Tax=Kingdonia uniflora TaxID=39325 RepID=A0A7J7NFY1_9MAGN|nr:hypothetical protein GIB67_023805 [Kingdonia uniflora]
MNNKVRNIKASNPKRSREKFRPSKVEDPFFISDSKRQKKIDDEEIHIDESDGDSDQDTKGIEEEEESEFATETADEKKLRLANKKLQAYRGIADREISDEDDDSDGGYKKGKRDSLVESMFQQEHLEENGRVRKLFASRVQKPEPLDVFKMLAKHRQSVTAVTLAEDDLTGFSASKDGTIIQWDVESGKYGKYVWPEKVIMKSHGAKDTQNLSKKWSRHVLDIAVSSDGRYLATGGLDRHVHLWDTRTRQHIQAFPGHKGPVSCLTFRKGSPELISGSFDRTIKLWNAEERAYMDTLFGHQGEVLTVDCLRKERLLTVGRDRTMHLWKVPEESQLVFRATTYLQCGCFIGEGEFLSGSDDGSIEFWSLLKKKHVDIFEKAHPVLTPLTVLQGKYSGVLNENKADNGIAKGESNSSSALSWVSSVSVCRNSDLAASGAGNGEVRLWAIESDAKIKAEKKMIRPLFSLPIVGFVNSLAFAKSGKFLVAGVGQEPRLGRWGRIPAARNGVLVQSLNLLKEGE